MRVISHTVNLCLAVLLATASVRGAAARWATDHPGEPQENHRHGRTGGSVHHAGLANALCPLANLANVQVTPFPIKMDDVCGSFKLNVANNAVACAAFGQMGSIMGNPPLRCAPDAVPVHPDKDPQGEQDRYAALQGSIVSGIHAMLFNTGHTLAGLF